MKKSRKKHSTIAKKKMSLTRIKKYGTKVKRKCKLCGKIFYKRVSEVKIAPCNFCSNKCKYIVLHSLVRKPESYLKTSQTRRINGSYSASNQYSNCKRGRRKDLGNQFFRSGWEANTARLLNFEKRKWKYEIKTFWFLKIKRGVRSYTPDFYLPEEDIYIEVKGWWDKKSLTKMKRMKKYYPNVKIEIWDNDFFKSLKQKGIDKLINNWE